MEAPNFIKRERPKLYDVHFGTWDLETMGLGGDFLDSAVYTDEEGRERYRALPDLFERMLNPPREVSGKTGRPRRYQFTWYAHNGARFDFTYIALMILDYANSNDVTIESVAQGTRIIALTIPTPSGKVRIADSFPALQTSLAGAAKAYAPDFSKSEHCPDHDFTKNDDVYYSPECPVCVAYMMRDAESLYHVMRNFESSLHRNLGVNLKLTTGSIAMAGFQRNIPKGHVYYRQSASKENFMRKVGVGSLISPGCTSQVWEPQNGQELAAVTVDRGAAFAASMLEGEYPVSSGIWRDTWDEERFGFWEVIAQTPKDLEFPVIPFYTDHGRVFGFGRHLAYITSEQFREAVSAGYELEVIQGLVFNKLEPVFHNFIRKLEAMEYPPDGTPADPAVKAMVKNCRNSLNGKFNTNPDHSSLKFGPLPRDDDGKLLDGITPWMDDDGNPIPGGYLVTEIVEAAYIQPGWYAITTTRQALTMRRLLMKIPAEARGKVDTDSLTTRPEYVNRLVADGAVVLGPGYGNWKIEHGWLWVQSIGPKNYRGEDTESGKINYCKGIPRKFLAKNTTAHKRAGQGEKVQLTVPTLRTFQEMIKTGAETPAMTRLRSISTPASVTGWDHDPVTLEFRPRVFNWPV
jgi:hypothetical protein